MREYEGDYAHRLAVQAICGVIQLTRGDTVSLGVISRHPHLHLRLCKVAPTEAAVGTAPIGLRQTSLTEFMPDGSIQFPMPQNICKAFNLPVPAMRAMQLTKACEVTVVFSDGQQHVRPLTCKSGSGGIASQWRPLGAALRLKPHQIVNVRMEEVEGRKLLHITNVSDQRPPDVVKPPEDAVSYYTLYLFVQVEAHR